VKKVKELQRPVAKVDRAFSLKSRPKSDLLILPYFQGEKKVEPAFSENVAIPEVDQAVQSGDFKGKSDEILVVYPKGTKEKRVVLLGLGSKKEESPHLWRQAYGTALRLATSKSLKSASVLIPSGKRHQKEVEGIVEGLLLGNYTFEGYKAPPHEEKSLESLTLIGVSAEELKKLESVRAAARGVYLARDLVNQNADTVTPAYLASVARSLAKQKGISTTVFGKKELVKQGFGLILAVGRGASVDPALIICRYKGDPKSKDHTVIVGKGVSYDTGGLDLKENMLTMKGDMGGAAACLGFLYAASLQKLKANFTVVIPSVENAISDRSYKPGDVYRCYNGKSVEIGNTDAEGRLILADALSYVVKKLKPTEIIDLATLTGAMVVALGHEVTGYFSTTETLAHNLEKAAQASDERLCRFPLIPEHRKKIQSKIADFVNIGGRDGGAVTAAIFLQQFVGKTPWAHLDIAGTSYHPEGRGHLSKFGTGVGVRLLMEYFRWR